MLYQGQRSGALKGKKHSGKAQQAENTEWWAGVPIGELYKFRFNPVWIAAIRDSSERRSYGLLPVVDEPKNMFGCGERTSMLFDLRVFHPFPSAQVGQTRQ